MDRKVPNKHISLSNPQSGNLRIINIANNQKQNCKLEIMDYQTLHIIHQLSPPFQWVRNVKISADGGLVAVEYYTNYPASFRANKRWMIYNLNFKKELYFVDKRKKRMNHVTFKSMEFCPNVLNSCNFISLCYINKDIKLWKIQDNHIQCTGKEISFAFKVESYRWMQNGSKILLWGRKYYVDCMGRPEKLNTILECQIQIWNFETWHRLRSMEVPSYIVRQQQNLFKPSGYVNNAGALHNVNYIDNDCTVLILGYSKIIGLIKVPDNGVETVNLIEDFMNSFQPIFKKSMPVNDISISDDQQFITIDIDDRNDAKASKLVIRMLSGQPQSYLMLKPSNGNKLTKYIPDSSRLIIYDYDLEYCIYEYNLKANNLRWQTIKNKEIIYFNEKREIIQEFDEEILSTCCAFINHDPLMIQLIQKDGKSELKVYNYKEDQQSTKVFCYSLDEPYDRCFTYNNLQSAVVIRTYLEDCKRSLKYKNVSIAEKPNLLNMRDSEKCKELLRYDTEPEVTCVTVTGSKYREKDNTLIFVMNVKHSVSCGILVAAINLCDGAKTIYEDKYAYSQIRPIYFDDNYLITNQQKVNSNDYCIMSYKLGNSKAQILNKEEFNYHRDRGLACKVNLPGKYCIDSLKIKCSSLKIKEDLVHEIWKDEDAKIFLVFDQNYRILRKSCKNRAINLEFDSRILNFEELSSENLFLTFNINNSNIYIYELNTLQLIHKISFPYFIVQHTKWNPQQSSFILSDGEQRYNIFKKIKQD
ncbi:uncharacterized protein TRIADDRAFT_60817 [Trichoplax adhaerens]|uniref:Uncharacterized protein n=1 Tax=Trichoplax adhaerens TaxID=10228 RepID=B3S991_TRIAD|nr:predicted protein [Trichoplax adhaerens]EDV20606.1 predicted protein [Trichoplax adhaerens]|eukprot:XP_002116806.1 predicted protein [Trichoplax adhaerens]